MKVCIIGQGASGVTLSLMLKKEDPTLDITILDHNDKTNKKLLATGNGRCNLGNLEIKKYSYNNDFGFKIYNKFDVNKQRDFFESIGLITRNLNELVYPYSLSSNQVVGYFNKLLKEYKVKLINKVKIDDYKVNEDNVEVTFNNKTYKFDKVIFACGGMSTPSLGSDGSLYKLFKKHNYNIIALKPGLTPVIVKENVKGIENERLKGNVKLFINNKLTYEEEGEVLFKKNGLSGIAIFNASSFISRSSSSSKIKIIMDLFPKISESELLKNFEKYSSFARFSFIEGIFSLRVSEFIRKNSNAKNLYKFDSRDLKNIAHYCKNMEFNYEKNYDFNSSQVSVGGIDTNLLNDDLSSKLEKNVYFAGEVINVDGLCGGFNLMFAFACSYVIKEALINNKK